uniref:Uncharacterized protein n=1 Tax=Arundo donax TaxID=35708 RepID=A0A0A8ZAI9_ARUDO
MRAPASLLHATTATADQPSSPSEPQPVLTVDSDMVIILASFLCALPIVLGSPSSPAEPAAASADAAPPATMTPRGRIPRPRA